MHKFVIASLAVAVMFAAVATTAQADEDLRAIVRDEIAKAQAQEEDPKTLKVYWDKGLKFKGKNWKGSLTGRIFIDVGFIDDKDYVAATGEANSPSYVKFRRLRMGTKGQFGKHVAYKVEIDFAGNSVGIRDAWIEYKGLRDCYGCGFPVVQVGHFFEPMGLEQLGSSKYITFIERSTVTKAFAPERSMGLMAKDVWRGGQMGYSLGVFAGQGARFSNDSDGSGDADLEAHGWAVTGRYWWAPWYDCNCACKRLHVGVSASYRRDFAAGNGVRFRARPGISEFSHRPVSTGVIDAEDVIVYGLELAWVYGPWSIQAEYLGSEVSGKTGVEDGSFWGFYAQASYWLTGECRNYKNGQFSRVSPCCDWLDNDCCCKGAWEIAARYNFLDLDDGVYTGGEMTTIEVGLNWHLNPNARIMWNLVFANVDRPATITTGDEDITMFVTRFQVDW